MPSKKLKKKKKADLLWGPLWPLALGHAQPRDAGAADQENWHAVALHQGMVKSGVQHTEERCQEQLQHFHFTLCAL